MCTPASSAASMTEVPAGTAIVAPWGRKVTLTVGGCDSFIRRNPVKKRFKGSRGQGALQGHSRFFLP